MAGVVAAVFNVLICIGIPLTVCIVLWRKDKFALKVFFFGVCGYFVSQLLLRQPVLALLQGIDEYRVFAALHPLGLMFFLAVTAALFEETARFLIYRLAVKTPTNKAVPVYYGLGHGGLEAFTVGLNNVALLLMAGSYLMNTGWMVALAGFERISVMIVQVALSMIVYTGKRGLLVAILLHTLYDFVIVLLSYGWSQIALEGLLFAMSLAVLAIAVKMQKRSAQK
ncbi:MAG: YhfC family glutamic-type intramembrane protease [Peptococcaceae bacterium]|nr:YhfC family glutamic-type intramembrane protease [Peptococcaceae bacterium]